MTTPDPQTVHPWGDWPSPLSAELVAGSSIRFGHIATDRSHVYWTESRPAEKGRSVLMRARPGLEPEELTPAPFSVRSRVHEYGGGEFHVADGVVSFVNDGDGGVYRLVPGIMPELVVRRDGWRFADFAHDDRRQRLIAIAEIARTEPALPDNVIVGIGLAGDSMGRIDVIASGRSFYASPRLSPDGGQLAFLAWDLPDMPWDSASLQVAGILPDGTLAAPQVVIGGGDAAAFQPEWLPDGSLLAVADITGPGNLYRWQGDALTPVHPMPSDMFEPLWSLSARSYAPLADGSIALVTHENGEPTLVLLDPGRGSLTHIPARLAGISGIVAWGDGVAGEATFHHTLPAIVTVARSGAVTTLRSSGSVRLDPAGISVGRPLSWRDNHGDTIHGCYYPPVSTQYRGPDGSRPPAILRVHGGPTGASGRGLSLKTQYWTSRGFAVMDVEYSGSTGFGRDYRRRLDGQWGVRDVADVISAAEHLVASVLADPHALFLTGGSAGGFTVLLALAQSRRFAAASCYFGVTDLAQLLAITHKFESGYLYRLTGTSPGQTEPVFAERSPLLRASQIVTPVILFQGLDDKVVPPEQARALVAVLRSNGVAHEYVEFPGEGHGFRQAQTIARALEAEHAFFLRAMRGC